MFSPKAVAGTVPTEFTVCVSDILINFNQIFDERLVHVPKTFIRVAYRVDPDQMPLRRVDPNQTPLLRVNTDQTPLCRVVYDQ